MPSKNPRAEYHRQWKATRVAEIRAMIHEAKSGPCMDCGLEWPYYVMQFDHVRGEKLFSVSAFINNTIDPVKIRAEIAKCDTVCANCHAIRSHNRSGR